jgi:hypothetical protein
MNKYNVSISVPAGEFARREIQNFSPEIPLISV